MDLMLFEIIEKFVFDFFLIKRAQIEKTGPVGKVFTFSGNSIIENPVSK